jgi:hypothetical protein
MPSSISLLKFLTFTAIAGVTQKQEKKHIQIGFRGNPEGRGTFFVSPKTVATSK